MKAHLNLLVTEPQVGQEVPEVGEVEEVWLVEVK
jgi:hypothetical protein